MIMNEATSNMRPWGALSIGYTYPRECKKVLFKGMEYKYTMLVSHWTFYIL